MPRREGNTPQRQRGRKLGHRMHRRTRVVRKVAKLGQGRASSGWNPASVWNDELGTWVV